MPRHAGIPPGHAPSERDAAPAPDADRRAHPRYSPDPWLPVVFSSRRTDEACAGHIVDISEGGLRLVAPPSCPCPLVWGDPLELTLSYSESTRRVGLEGLALRAVVVRVVSDAKAYVVQARFKERAQHDRLQLFLERLARETGERPSATPERAS